MPRTARAAEGGLVYHVLNRGNGRMKIFRKPGDYEAFVRLLIDGLDRAAVAVFGYCLMPNHWHIVLRPKGDGDLSAYLSWVSNTHVRRYRAHYSQTSGHLYQGRFKSFAVEEESYFVNLLRYVEANPKRANLVQRAEQWKWSSLGCDGKTRSQLLSEWPLEKPRQWTALVNEDLGTMERQRIKTSMERDRPLGREEWAMSLALRLGLGYTLNPRGRPAKTATKDHK